jgi:NitT/TauT family transport system permease protein
LREERGLRAGGEGRDGGMRGRTVKPWGEWLWRAVTVLAIGSAWEVVARTGAVSEFWISSPTRVGGFLWRQMMGGDLVRHLGVTLLEAGVGYGIGGILGIVVGLVFAEWGALGRVMEPVVQALYAMPRIALAPLFILWFGIGLTSKIVLVAIVVFFLVFMAVLAGARTVDVVLRRLVVLWGARSRWAVIRTLTLPAVGAWVMSGLATSLPYAVVAAVTGEYIASSAGVGYLIALYSNRFNATGAMACIMTLVLVVMVMHATLRRIEGRVLRWQGSDGAGRGEMY